MENAFAAAMKNIFLTTLLLWGFSVLSQHQTNPSEYALLYKVSAESARLYFETGDDEILLERVLADTPRDTFYHKDEKEDRLPAERGAYLLLWAEKGHLQWKFLFQHDFFISLQSLGKEVLLHLYDRYTYEPITDAVVYTERVNVTYDPRAEAYVFKLKGPKDGAEEDIFIEQDSNLLLTNVSREYNYKEQSFLEYNLWRVRHFFRKLFLKDHRIHGYIALNKPKFRAGDTLRFKAFLLNAKGESVSPKDISVEVTYYDPFSRKRKTHIIEDLDFYRAGALKGSLVLADSLEGKTLMISAKRKEMQHGLWQSFRVEDYRLDEITFEAEVLNDKGGFSPEVPAKIQLSAKDDNGLPVLDGKVKIKISSSRVDHSPKVDRAVVPDVLLDTVINLDPVGKTLFKYTGAELPPVPIDLRAELRFYNSENEQHRKYLPLKYDTQPALEVEESERGFHISQADSAGDQQDFTLWGYQEQDVYGYNYFHASDTLVFKKDIVLPHFEKWSPAVDRYVIKSGGENLRSIEHGYLYTDPQYGFQDGVLYIYFPQAGRKPVLYEIYVEGRKRCVAGRTNGDTVFYSGPEADYLVLRSSFQYAKGSGWRSTLIPLTNIYDDPLEMLGGAISGPQRVRPGDSARWELSVTDQQGEACGNLDLVAVSVKKAFNALHINTSLPDQPYNRKITRPLDYHFEISPWDKDVSSRSLLKKAYEHLNLGEQQAYKYFFQNSALLTDTFALPDRPDHGEFAAFVFDGAEKRSLHAIYADGVPIYAYHLTHEKFSFPLKPAIYMIELRGRDFSLKVPNINIYRGKKTEIALNLEQLPEGAVLEDRPGHFTPEEWGKLANHTLFSQSLSGNFYFSEGPRWVRGNRWVSKAGPFRKGEATYWSPQTDSIRFYFEPGMEYRFRGNVVMASERKVEYSKNELPDGIVQNPGEILGKPRAKPINEQARIPVVRQEVSQDDPNGSLSVRNATDSTFFYFLMYHYEGDTVYSGADILRRYNTWRSGTYRLQVFTKSFHSVAMDSIPIKADARTYIWLRPEGFLPSKTDSVLQQLQGLQSKVKEKLGQGITGKVFDATTGEPVPFASIVLKAPNGEIVNGGITDIDGKYNISIIPAGTYTLEASFVGYSKSIITGLLVSPDQLTVQDFLLRESSEQLEEVVLNYEAPLIDKTKSAKVTSMASYALVADEEVRGARGEGTVNFIDGVKVPGEQAAIAQSRPENEAPGPVTADRLLHILNSGNSGLRRNFRDYAFFIPDITTDEKGRAVINTKFPDDVNAWKTTFIGMDEGFKYFEKEVETQSFSEVTSRLVVPSYLREGDSCLVIGKTLNYLDTTLQVKTTFEVDDQLSFDTRRNISSSLIDYLPVKARGDSVSLKYTLELPGSFRDGEFRKVPVRKPAMSFSEGVSVRIDKDTLIKIENPKNFSYSISAMQGSEEVLLDVAETLSRYPYGCNEQLASRLKALLAQEKILKRHDKTFKRSSEVTKIITTLLKARSTDGGWGWIGNQPSQFFMTSYVLEALHQAQQMGYEVPYSSRATLLEDMMLDMEPHERVNPLYTLHKLGEDVAFEYFFKGIEWDSLRVSEKLKYAVLAESHDLSYDAEKVDRMLKTDILGNKYVEGDHVFSLNGSVRNSLLMAEWLRLKDREGDVKSIRDHFLLLVNLHSLNTIEKAAAINLLDMVGSDEIVAGSEVVLNDEALKLKAGHPQFSTTVKHNNIELRVKTDSPVYLNISHEHIVEDPEVYSKYFAITTSWEEKKGEVPFLTAGKTVDYKINIDAERSAEYVLIQIPKLAGSLLEKRPYSYGGNYYVEEKRDHLNLYVTQLQEGENTFSLPFNSRFKGEFALEPVKVELMYFPVFYGNNAMGRVEVK